MSNPEGVARRCALPSPDFGAAWTSIKLADGVHDRLLAQSLLTLTVRQMSDSLLIDRLTDFASTEEGDELLRRFEIMRRLCEASLKSVPTYPDDWRRFISAEDEDAFAEAVVEVSALEAEREAT